MGNQATTPITDVRTVAVPVTDQGRALGCYTGTLGLELRTDAMSGPGQRWRGVPAMFTFRCPDGNRLVIVREA